MPSEQLTIKSALNQFNQSLPFYSAKLDEKVVALMQAEEQLVYAFFEKIASKKALEGSIHLVKQFLQIRGKALFPTNLNYFRHPFSPANQLCVKIAELIAKPDDAILKLILPHIFEQIPSQFLKDDTEEEGHFNPEKFIFDGTVVIPILYLTHVMNGYDVFLSDKTLSVINEAIGEAGINFVTAVKNAKTDKEKRSIPALATKIEKSINYRKQMIDGNDKDLFPKYCHLLLHFAHELDYSFSDIAERIVPHIHNVTCFSQFLLEIKSLKNNGIDYSELTKNVFQQIKTNLTIFKSRADILSIAALSNCFEEDFILAFKGRWVTLAEDSYSYQLFAHRFNNKMFFKAFFITELVEATKTIDDVFSTVDRYNMAFLSMEYFQQLQPQFQSLFMPLENTTRINNILSVANQLLIINTLFAQLYDSVKPSSYKFYQSLKNEPLNCFLAKLAEKSITFELIEHCLVSILPAALHNRFIQIVNKDLIIDFSTTLNSFEAANSAIKKVPALAEEIVKHLKPRLSDLVETLEQATELLQNNVSQGVIVHGIANKLILWLNTRESYEKLHDVLNPQAKEVLDTLYVGEHANQVNSLEELEEKFALLPPRLHTRLCLKIPTSIIPDVNTLIRVFNQLEPSIDLIIRFNYLIQTNSVLMYFFNKIETISEREKLTQYVEYKKCIDTAQQLKEFVTLFQSFTTRAAVLSQFTPEQSTITREQYVDLINDVCDFAKLCEEAFITYLNETKHNSISFKFRSYQHVIYANKALKFLKQASPPDNRQVYEEVDKLIQKVEVDGSFLHKLKQLMMQMHLFSRYLYEEPPKSDETILYAQI